MTEPVSESCANCETPLQGAYCHACGQRRVEPIGFGMMARMLSRETIELDGRLVHTLIELTRRPGVVIRDYLDGHRVELYNPGKYLFMTTTVAIVLFSLMGVQLMTEEQRAGFDPDALRAIDIFIALSAYLNFIVALLIAVPQALMSKLGPVQRNLAESFVVQLFVQGQVTVPIILITLLLPAYAHLSGLAASLLLLPYLAWVLRTVHGVSTGRAVLQSVVVFITYLLVSSAMFTTVQLAGVSWLAGT